MSVYPPKSLDMLQKLVPWFEINADAADGTPSMNVHSMAAKIVLSDDRDFIVVSPRVRF
jgi:hypothetical protein